MIRTIFSKLAPVTCALSLISSVALAELPQITDAKIIQPPPGANVAAAYFSLTNSGADALTISGVRSNVAKMTELHLSKVENDVARMIKQEQIVIESGESLDFKHGSYHVMFMGLSDTLQAGDTIDVVLETSAGELRVSIPVISPDEHDAMKKSMQHDKKMDHDKDAN